MRTSNTKIRILEFLTEYVQTHGYVPSVREIAQGVGVVSTSTVHHHLRALQEEGQITMVEGKARTIQICEPIREETNIFTTTVSEVLTWFKKRVSESCTDCAKTHDFSCSGANADRCRAYRVALKLCQDYLNNH